MLTQIITISAIWFFGSAAIGILIGRIIRSRSFSSSNSVGKPIQNH